MTLLRGLWCRLVGHDAYENGRIAHASGRVMSWYNCRRCRKGWEG